MARESERWIQSSTVIPMFPTLVWKIQLEPRLREDPRSQASVIRPPVTELTAENTDQVVVPVRNGTLLMFPAYLPHSVDETASDEERISVSFNLMFSAFTENLANPLW